MVQQKHNQTQWDTVQLRKIKNIWQKLNFPNPFQNNPNPRNLKI